jgi:hypothetical protein
MVSGLDGVHLLTGGRVAGQVSGLGCACEGSPEDCSGQKAGNVDAATQRFDLVDGEQRSTTNPRDLEVRAAMDTKDGRVFCTYEDRAECLVGVQVLALSLHRHDAGARLALFCPAALQSRAERQLSNAPNVSIRSDAPERFSGWNAKPSILLRLLSEGAAKELAWIDTDIVVCSSLNALLDGFPRDTLILTEEWRWGRSRGTALRTTLWGLKIGRTIRRTINSCVVRVTPRHIGLLQRWTELLDSPTYRAAQAAHWRDRPLHMMGDQDALGALLGSVEFADCEVDLLRAGRDIAQCFQEDGYSLAQRLGNAIQRRVPTLIHAQGPKPWATLHSEPYLQLSPYTAMARAYVGELHGATDWTEPSARSARLLDHVFRGDPNLRGLPFVMKRLPRRVASQVTYRLNPSLFDHRIELANRQLLAPIRERAM